MSVAIKIAENVCILNFKILLWLCRSPISKYLNENMTILRLLY